MRAVGRSMRPRWGHLWAALGVTVLLGAWEGGAYLLAATNAYGNELLPTIQHVVLISIPGMARFGSVGAGSSVGGALGVLADNSYYTLLRLVVGTGLGIVIGVGLGMLISWNRLLRRVVEPPILIVRNVPLLILIPLFILWFGSSEVGKYIYVAFAVSVMLVVNTVQAIENVRPIYLDYARTLGAGGGRLIRTVVVPGMLPEVLAGIKVALGVSWAIVLAAEFLAATNGLGYLLIMSETFFDVGRMMVIVLVFILYSFVLNTALDRLVRRLTRWMP